MVKLKPTSPDLPDTILHKIVRESPSLAASTKRLYLTDVTAWVAFAGADPAGWTRWKAQEFYTHLCGRMKIQSANRVMATLAYVAGWRAKMEARPELDFSQIQKARPDDVNEREALTPAQAQQLLQVAGTLHGEADRPRMLRDVALFTVGLETGMRRISLESMRLELTGHDAKLGYVVTRVRLKGKPPKYRYPVPLSEAAVVTLERWTAFLAAHGLTTGPVWRSLGRRIEGLEIGKSLSAQSLYDITVKHGEAAGLPAVTPHIFRHTFISWRLDAGVPPEQIAAITGHQLPLRLARGDRQVDLGALAGYVDPKFGAAKASSATPPWLLHHARGK